MLIEPRSVAWGGAVNMVSTANLARPRAGGAHEEIEGSGGSAMRYTPRITVVSAPACHFCEDADQALQELAREFAVAVSQVALDSAEGRRLVAEHRPAMSPLVLLEGAYFSSGRLPRKKLARALARMGAATLSRAGSGALGGAGGK